MNYAHHTVGCRAEEIRETTLKSFHESITDWLAISVSFPRSHVQQLVLYYFMYFIVVLLYGAIDLVNWRLLVD